MLDPMKEVVREHLPKRPCRFNGVNVRTYKWRNGTYRPDFEEAIACELRERVEEGDRLVVVGGGHGVCSVIAARAGAEVTTYEPGGFWCRTIRETAGLNGVEDRLAVVHAAVGPIHDAWSSPKGAGRLEASDLPECDWLVLDCEGAEMDILDDLEIRPRMLSVETHPPRVLTVEAGAQLECMGYSIYKRIEGRGADVLHAEADDR